MGAFCLRIFHILLFLLLTIIKIHNFCWAHPIILYCKCKPFLPTKERRKNCHRLQRNGRRRNWRPPAAMKENKKKNNYYSIHCCCGFTLLLLFPSYNFPFSLILAINRFLIPLNLWMNLALPKINKMVAGVVKIRIQPRSSVVRLPHPHKCGPIPLLNWHKMPKFRRMPRSFFLWVLKGKYWPKLNGLNNFEVVRVEEKQDMRPNCKNNWGRKDWYIFACRWEAKFN